MNISDVLGLFPTLLQGAAATLTLFVVVLLLSIPLGFLFTLMVRSRVAPLRWLAGAFITVMRGTPLLLQLFFIYFGLPFLPVVGQYLRFESFTAAVIGFVFNYAAYFAEIYRGGLLAIDQGQYEAAHVLGLTRLQTTVRVIIPQMIRVALPSVTNESINLVKDTALMYAVAVPEILHFAKASVISSANPAAFAVAAVIYLGMNAILTLGFKRLEKRMSY